MLLKLFKEDPELAIRHREPARAGEPIFGLLRGGRDQGLSHLAACRGALYSPLQPFFHLRFIEFHVESK